MALRVCLFLQAREVSGLPGVRIEWWRLFLLSQTYEKVQKARKSAFCGCLLESWRVQLWLILRMVSELVTVGILRYAIALWGTTLPFSVSSSGAPVRALQKKKLESFLLLDGAPSQKGEHMMRWVRQVNYMTFLASDHKRISSMLQNTLSEYVILCKYYYVLYCFILLTPRLHDSSGINWN